MCLGIKQVRIPSAAAARTTRSQLNKKELFSGVKRKYGELSNSFPSMIQDYIGSRVKKWFSQQSSFFYGTVLDCFYIKSILYYHVMFDDDDEEDFTLGQLQKIIYINF